MPVIPLGFTPITPDYTPFDIPPDTSGLIENDLPLLLDGKIVIATEAIPSVDTPISVLPADDWQVTLRAVRTYVAPGELIELQCEINKPANGNFLVRLINATGSLVDLPDRAIVGTLQQGIGSVQFRLGPDTSYNSNLIFIAYLPTVSNTPTLRITQEELTQLTYRSNTVNLFVFSNATDVLAEPPVPPQIPVIPLHDVGVTSSTSTLKSYIIQEQLDLAPTNAAPRGSVGQGIYSDHNLASPANRSMHLRVPANALQRLLGAVQDQLKRLQAWSEKILYIAHAAEENPDSELSLLSELLPDNFIQALTRYRELINQAGKYASDVAQTYIPDYANGNTLIQSNAVEQHNVGQMRVQTTSVYDVNSPSVNIAAQQSVTQARFEHHAGDVYQGSHIDVWVRAEDNLTLIADQSVHYTTKESAELSANILSRTGDLNAYADAEFEQVGQLTQVPLHPTNSRSQIRYGKSTKLVLKDYVLKTFQGKVLVRALTNFIELVSGLGIKLVALGESIDIASIANNVRVQAPQKTLIYGGESFSANSPNEVQITGSARTVIQGGLTFINCGVSALEVPDAITPTVVADQLRIYPPLRNPAEYPRETPLAPGGVGQSIPNTPEPNATPGGPVGLGKFFAGLTRPRPQSNAQPSSSDAAR